MAKLSAAQGLYSAVFQCEKPNKKIYDFLGLYEHTEAQDGDKSLGEDAREPMNIDNTMWANTVLAS